MVRSLYSGVSGLINHQTRMDVIGNNIANVNTYGFKSYRVTFRDVLGQNTRTAATGAENAAGNNPSEVGYGVQVGSIDRDMSTSSFQTTNRSLDVFIDGDGFFVTSTFGPSPDGGTPTNTQGPQDIALTRMGNFGVDNLGRLVSADSRFIMGSCNTYKGLRSVGEDSSRELANQALNDENNDMKINSNDLTWSNTININKLVQEAYNIHTDSNGYMYTYKIRTAGVAPAPDTFSDPTPAEFEAMFHTDADRDGHYDIDADEDGIITPAEEATYAAALATPIVGLERVACTKTGEMIPIDANSTIDYTHGGTAVSLDNYNDFYDLTSYLKYYVENGEAPDDPANPGTPLAIPGGGVAPTGITDAQDQLTALNHAAKDLGLKLDTLSYKDLSTFSIGENGVISVTYNSETKAIARIDLGVVDNPEGLEQAGSTSFKESGASGPIGIKAPDGEGTGSLRSQRLEMSNVNLATEFSDMIITQRGYQANSRIITTSDSMLEELVNLKR
jgi:flagellar hook protein FlgE